MLPWPPPPVPNATGWWQLNWQRGFYHQGFLKSNKMFDASIPWDLCRGAYGPSEPRLTRPRPAGRLHGPPGPLRPIISPLRHSVGSVWGGPWSPKASSAQTRLLAKGASRPPRLVEAFLNLPTPRPRNHGSLRGGLHGPPGSLRLF